MVENEAVNISAYVRIYKDPTGVLWHNFLKSVRIGLSYYDPAECSKLQFEEGDRHGGSEESGSNLLSQFAPSIALLHKCFSKGMVSSPA